MQFFAHFMGKKLQFKCSRPLEGAGRGGGEKFHTTKTVRGVGGSRGTLPRQFPEPFYYLEANITAI